MSACLLVSTRLEGVNDSDLLLGLIVGIFLLIIAGYFIIDRWVSLHSQSAPVDLADLPLAQEKVQRLDPALASLYRQIQGQRPQRRKTTVLEIRC